MRDILKKMDIPLLIATLILSIFGLIMIFSSSNVAAVLQYGYEEQYFFKKQLKFFLAGLFIAFVIIYRPTKKYNVISKLGIIGILLVLFSLKTYGTVTNNARSWFRVLGVSVQPSEFAKTIMVLYLANVYGVKKKIKTISELFMPLIPCVILFFLVALEPDLGTASIIASICAFIFFALPIEKCKPMRIIKIGTVICVIVGVLLIGNADNLLTNTQLNRLDYKNPCSRYLSDTGYQVCNGYIAIHNGGLFGVGLGNSSQKYLYLPEAHTDFIFPIIVEELGLIGGIIVILMLLFVLFRILIIARNAKTLRGSIIAFGVFGYIFTHIFINMGGLLGLIPLTGVPLPFLSYGGSFMLNLMAMLGLVQRVCIESKMKG